MANEPELQTDVKIGIGGQSRRTSDDNKKYDMMELPDELKGLSTVTISHGNMKEPAPGFKFKVSEDSDVYLAVHNRGGYRPPKDWNKTDMNNKSTCYPTRPCCRKNRFLDSLGMTKKSTFLAVFQLTFVWNYVIIPPCLPAP